MLQAWQAYHDLTYESKWKAEIDSQWTEYVNNWKAENPDLPVDQTRFAFMNTFIKAKFADETEETKELVENHRRSLSQSFKNTNLNATYQQLVNLLLKV
jgi:uncharacterized protein YijF (DUF1287 family)